jgi:hypothetical protein
LAKAKLPPRMERDYQEKIAQKSTDKEKSLEIIKEKGGQEPRFYKKPPNFEEIHRKFEEGM